MNLTEVFELGKQIIIKKNNSNVNSYLSTPDDSNDNVPVTREVEVVESETEQDKIEAVLEATDMQG